MNQLIFQNRSSNHSYLGLCLCMESVVEDLSGDQVLHGLVTNHFPALVSLFFLKFTKAKSELRDEN